MISKNVLAVTSVIIISGIVVTYFLLESDNVSIEANDIFNIDITPIKLAEKGEGDIFTSEESDLFEVFAYESDLSVNSKGVHIAKYMHFKLKNENKDIYREIGVTANSKEAVVVVPFFTMTAYADSGFYEYYKKKCDENCIESIPIKYDELPTFESSEVGIRILKLLGYPIVTDIEVDKYPDLLKEFDKVILLHNEYVTRTEFDAIIDHPKVIYLYPNALYAEISVDYENQTITLERGHNFPEPQIRNGFDWKFDNSKLEYDYCSSSWEFSNTDNGIMLSCYPEHIMFKDHELLIRIKDY